MRGLLVLVVAVASSGCLSHLQSIVAPADETTRSFACDLMTGDPPQLVIQVWVEVGVEDSPVTAVDQLRDELANLSGRMRSSIAVRMDNIVAPKDGWSDGWNDLMADHRYRQRQSMELTLYWLQHRPDVVPAPGVVVVGQALVDAKGGTDDVAFAVLLHQVGHALGVVNRGIPMQENHEGDPGHSRDVGSVMHQRWEIPGPAAQVPSTFDDAVRRDLQEAEVCV